MEVEVEVGRWNSLFIFLRSSCELRIGIGNKVLMNHTRRTRYTHARRARPLLRARQRARSSRALLLLTVASHPSAG